MKEKEWGGRKKRRGKMRVRKRPQKESKNVAPGTRGKYRKISNQEL